MIRCKNVRRTSLVVTNDRLIRLEISFGCRDSFIEDTRFGYSNCWSERKFQIARALLTPPTNSVLLIYDCRGKSRMSILSIDRRETMNQCGDEAERNLKCQEDW